MSAANPTWPGRGVPFEGAFAYSAPWYWKPAGGPPYLTIDAGEGAIIAGAMPGQSGIAAGRFGWFNPATRLALNREFLVWFKGIAR